MSTSRSYAFWGNWVLEHPFGVLSTVIVLGILAAHYTVGHLRIDTDTGNLIAPDAPFQQYRRHYEQAFSQDLSTLLLVIESDTPELTKSASRRLLDLLSNDTDHFNSAYIPNDNEFFRQNGLLYLDTDALQTLSNDLSVAQPFIGRIAQQPNLTGFFSIFEDALKATDKAATEKNQLMPIDLASLADKISLVLHKTLNGENALLSWESLIAEKKRHAGKAFIIVSPKLDHSEIRPAQGAIEAIRKAAADIQDPALPAVKVWVTGEIGLEDDELAGMSSGTFTASVFSVVLVLFILLIAYRSVLLTVVTLLTLALGMVFCGAFAAIAVTELNLISLAFAVSNIGLGVEYAIHFCLRYRDNLKDHVDKELALRDTFITVGPSLLLAAGTTSIGLYAFIPTDYKGVAELGLLAGTSLFICLLITLISLPALLKILPAPRKFRLEKGQHPLSNLSRKLATLPLIYAKPISIATLVLALISIVLAFNVKTDFSPINLRDPNTESVIAFKELMADEETTPLTLNVLTKDENSTKILQQKLSALASVDKTISLFDLQPTDQDEKLAVIEELGLILGPQGQQFPQLKIDADPVPGITRLIKTIDVLLPQKTGDRDRESLTRLKKELQEILTELKALPEPGQKVFIEKIQTALLGTLPPVMKELSVSLEARNISLTDLPPDIREQWLSKDGLFRVQIFPKKDLNDLANLKEFIAEVQTVAPETTGLPIIYWESMKEVVQAFQQAIVIALVAIAVVLLAIRRSFLDTALVMVTLILAGLFTMASAVLTHTPINFANIIALPLLLGLGVDNGIHMLAKLHSLSEEENIYESSTARAIVFGALTTSSSFGGLAFSPHVGISSMGLIITVGIFWIMVCTFIILPALSRLILSHKESMRPRRAG
ncbi:hopanoid biosynthesis-associated RND transporter HpnN [Nitrosospira lacus]|uniref:Hopanoid biosynthesis-associated RND transporter HpnN n=1 Tax=Nitrosospira lacus TaxID=1288494 RepID=A0A1W6SLN4_9PROT|nr:MMPL family transporter [Nitrosospira lacus]ARO86716.1 hopanoid biosynthesis-associated RND transporter HpnN [Nitrosospira lacus]